MSERHLAPAPEAAPLQPNGRLPFGFGKRFFLLFALGALWFIPAFVDRKFLVAVLLWDAVVLLGWLADLVGLPQPASIVVERSWDAAPALLTPSAMRLRISNPAAQTLRLSVADDLPNALRANEETRDAEAPPRDDAVVDVPLRPRQRGDQNTRLVYVKYSSSLQLAERWGKVEIPQTVRVYPDLHAARESSLYLTRSRRIELQMRMLRQRGMGREFESLREYQDGDELRDVCWTATARRGKLVTKLHQMEKSQPVWIVVDAGRLMRARVGELTKLDYLVNSAVSVAHMASQSGDRVGLITYGRKIQQRVPLGKGAAHMRLILDALALTAPEAPEADHLRALATLQKAQRRRSLVVWFTDLAETAMVPEVIEAASTLARHHLVLFVVCSQPELLAVAAARPKTTEGMYQSVAAQELVQRRERLIARLRERGALTLETAPHGLSSAVLNEYLRVKEHSLI